MSRKPALGRDAWLTATARGASLLGDEVAYVALAWRLKSHGPSAVMALTLALAVPQVIGSPWTGLLADRMSAKRLVRFVASAQALVCIALVWSSPVLSVLGPRSRKREARPRERRQEPPEALGKSMRQLRKA